MMKRDQFLDRMRTFAIVWVLMVHILYWLNFLLWGTLATVKSWLLMEMPLFFFISGASVALAKPRPWGEYVFRSFRRVMIPYWCYAVIGILLTAVYSGGREWHLVKYWLIPWNPQPTCLPFLTDALWFVPVYLMCVLVVPLLRRLKHRPWPVIALLVVLLLFFEKKGWAYPRNVAFYSFWIYLGLFYPQLKERYVLKGSKRWELAVVATVSIAVLIVLCRFFGVSADMQKHKFPPDGIFLLYSLGAMSLLMLISPALVKAMDCLGRVSVLNWGMEQLSRYSLSVFLYQSFAFIVLKWFTDRCDNVLPQSVQLVGCCLLILPLAVVLATAFGPMENLGRGKRRERI